jgi:ABC-2 type transport system permease protein
MLAAFTCFLIFSGFDALSSLTFWSDHALIIRQVGILYHYDSLSKGLIDSRDVLYFFSIMFLMLSVTKLIIGSRQW